MLRLQLCLVDDRMGNGDFLNILFSDCYLVFEGLRCARMNSNCLCADLYWGNYY